MPSTQTGGVDFDNVQSRVHPSYPMPTLPDYQHLTNHANESLTARTPEYHWSTSLGTSSGLKYLAMSAESEKLRPSYTVSLVTFK